MRRFSCLTAATIALAGGFLLVYFGHSRAIGRETDAAVAEKPDQADERLLTVFPVNIKPGKHASLELRTQMATVVGAFLERAGLQNVELARHEFTPPEGDDAKKIAAAFAKYVRENPPKTQYALFAQFVGTPQSGAKAIVTVLVDRSGKILLAERDTPCVISSLLKMWPKCPMECSLLVARRVQHLWGLADPLRPGAPTNGKMGELLNKQSMIPPKVERDAIQKRLDTMRKGLKDRSITVYPVHLAEGSAPGCTEKLVEAINARGLFKAVAGEIEPGLKVEGSFNEQRVLWGAARAFQQFIHKNPPQSEYALYVDYGIRVSPVKTPPGMKREAGFVHLILCDHSGELVMVDFQNSHQRDFQKIEPKTCEDCNRLVVTRLAGTL